MKIAICAIIKDEHRYLKEWIDYHLGIGFSHIHLFEDYGSKPHEEIVREYKDVTLSTVEAEGVADDRDAKCHASRQFNLYSKQIEKLSEKYDWAAFIDIDEFITLDDSVTLESLLEPYKEENGVYLYWKMYNANGLVEYEDKPVRERFTQTTECHPKKEAAWMVKSIVNLNKGTWLDSLHHVHDGVNTIGIKTARVRCYKKAWINHYFTKSWEEWCWRFTHRGDVANNYRKFDEFFVCNPDMIDIKKRLMHYYEHSTKRKEEWMVTIPLTDKLSAVQTPKCGCTTIAYVLAEKEGIKHTGYCHRDVHRQKCHGHPKGVEIFSIYRDPISRFVAFYQKNIVEDGCWYEFHFGEKPDNPTLDDVISEAEIMVNKYEPYYQDQHIRRQIDTYPLDKIDIIVPLEHLDAFLESRGITPPPHQNVSIGEKPTLTPEQEERIKKLYAADYELLKSPKVWKPSKTL